MTAQGTRPRRARGRWWQALVVVLFALAAGCAGGGVTSGTSTGKASDSGSGSASVTQGNDMSGGGSGGRTRGGGGAGGGGGSSGADDGFAWVPFGPANPGSPPPAAWYGVLERRSCPQEIASSNGPMWQAVYAVCAAALDGDRSQWAVVDRIGPVGPGDATSCLEKAAAEFLRAAYTWHRAHPDQQPKIRFATADSRRTACPFEISDVRLQDTAGSDLAGPVTGGTALALTVRGLDGDDTILIGGKPADNNGLSQIDEAGVTTVFVRTPATDSAGPAKIVLRNRAGEVRAAKTFRYEDAPPTTPTPTPTPTG